MTNDNKPVEGYDVITGSQAVIEGTMAITIKEYNELKAEIEELRWALSKIRSVVGTSTEAWLIANHALEQGHDR